MSRRSTTIHVALGVLLALNLLLAAWPGGWPVARAQGPVSGAEPGAGAQSAPPAGQPASRMPSPFGFGLPSGQSALGSSALPGRAGVIPAGFSAGIHWYTANASAFQPMNGPATFTHSSAWCLEPATLDNWVAPVYLPDGAVVKYILFNYQNSSASLSSSAAFGNFRYDGAPTWLVYAYSASSAETGEGFFANPSQEITSTLDNYNYFYFLAWQGSTTQWLCSVQIGYYPPPLSSLFLPLVTRGS
jgi:hypothetical protein